jgi:hypothetical protein|tara:strand:- start:27 stop:200 length:174 start_codon:yes stop_codon:yes gene_type:complete
MLKNKTLKTGRKSKKGMSMCKNKKTGYKCKRVKGCKTAKGKKRTFCRKIKNKTSKKK